MYICMYIVQLITEEVCLVVELYLLCQSHQLSLHLSDFYLCGSVCTQYFESFEMELKSWAVAPSWMQVAVCEAHIAVYLRGS